MTVHSLSSVPDRRDYRPDRGERPLTDGGPRLRVVCVGDGPATTSLERDPGTVVDRVDDDPGALDSEGTLAAADCAVVTPTVGEPVAAVAAIREATDRLPIVVCTADTATVRTARDAGATEFFQPPVEAAGWDLLRTRIETVVDRERATAGLRKTRDTLRELHAVSADPDLDFDERVERLLAVGANHLGVQDAFLSRVDEEAGLLDLQATSPEGDLVGDGDLALDTSYCRRTLESDEGRVALSDAPEQGWADDPAVQAHGLHCYLGDRITVDGEAWGTLCFVDEGAREPFDDDELALIGVLTDWVSGEIERRRSEDRVADVIGRMDDAFFAVDDEWHVTYANEGGRGVLAEAMEIEPTAEILGTHLWESTPEAVDTAFYEHYTRAMETQEPVTFDAEYEPMGVHFEVRAYPSETGLSVYFSDVTDRVHRERQLTRLNQVTQSLMRVDTTEEMADIVAEAASDVLGFAATGVRLHDPATDTLEMVSTASTLEELGERPTLSVGDSPHGRAFRTGEAVHETIGEDDPFDREQFAAVLYVPIGDHGVLSVATTDGTLSTSDRQLAGVLAANTAAALDRVEREEELLVRTRAMEEADVALTLVDPHAPDEPIVWANDGFEGVTGYESETAVGRNCRFLQGEATDPEPVAELRRAIDAEESTDVVLRNYRADGTPFWNHLEITPIFDDDGDLLRYLGSQADVTEEREREQRLQALLDFQRSLAAAGTSEQLLAALRSADVDGIGLHGFSVRRYDEATDRLEPLAVSGPFADHGDRPAFGPGSPYYEAYDRGEPVVDSVAAEDPYGRGDFDEVLYVPVGDHGVIATTGRDGTVDRTDRQTAELLATGVAAALDRIDRLERLELYEDVLETSQGMVYVADENRVLRVVTAPLARYLGYEPGELEGSSIDEVIGEERGAALDEAIRAALRETDADSVARETSLPTPAGSRPVEIEAALLPGESFRGTVGVIKDRSELAATRTERDLQRDRARHLLENLPDPVVETELTPDGARIIDVNDRFRAVFGPDRDLVGAEVDEVVLPEDRDRLEGDPDSIDDALREGRVVTETVRRRTADGFRDFLFRGIPFEADGSRRAFAVYTDITEQKHRERRLEVLNRVLRHNFRNRMSVISGYTDVLADRILGSEADLDPVMETAVGELQDGVDDVTGMNEQVRAIERAFQGDGGSQTDVVPVVEEVVEEYRERGAAIETKLPDALTATAGEGLQIAVEQLVDNAVEHGSTGSRPGADDAPVCVEAEAWTDGMVAIRVHDDGPGIPDGERAVVTGEQEITQLAHGSGLGLWTVKWIAEANGGGVEIESDDGTTVTLLLPGVTEDTAADRPAPNPQD